MFWGLEFYHAYQIHPGVFEFHNGWFYYFQFVQCFLALDAYRIAVRLRRGEAVHRWGWF